MIFRSLTSSELLLVEVSLPPQAARKAGEPATSVEAEPLHEAAATEGAEVAVQIQVHSAASEYQE